MDCNGYYNEAYKNIIGYGDNELPEDYLEFKDSITTYYKSKFSSEIKPDLSHGCLFEQELLVPVKEILSI